MDKRVWLAVNRNEGKIESCIVGTSDKIYAMHCLLEVLTGLKADKISIDSDTEQQKQRFNKINVLATDGNYSYDKVIKQDLFKESVNKHVIDKAETCLVESYNSSMRDRLARLGRKTKAFSKSQEMLELSLGLWMERKNTGRKDWKEFVGYGWG